MNREKDMNNQSVNRNTSAGYDQFFVAKQPIFNLDMDIWGYELLYRHAANTDTANFVDGDMATSTIIADGVTLVRMGIAGDKKILINFTSRLLLEEFGFALSVDNCIIEVLETVEPTPGILLALTRLKQAGYTLALDDYTGQVDLESLLELADIVKIDMLNTPDDKMRMISNKLLVSNKILLAEKVEHETDFMTAQNLGCTLFQGYFFKKPKIITGRKISSSDLSKLNIINELSNEDVDPIKISKIIHNDLALSYRLLGYINSAMFSRRESIDSIHRAVCILGHRNLAKWLQAVLLSDIDSSPKGAEIMSMALVRANLLELLGKQLDSPPAKPDTLFVLGLFSLLDSLLCLPMEEIVCKLPLGKQLTQSLLGESNDLTTLLMLAQKLECGEWDQANAIVAYYKYHPCDLASTYNKALMISANTLCVNSKN